MGEFSVGPEGYVEWGQAPPPEPPERRVLVCGSRHWTDQETIRKVITDLFVAPTVIIQGGAKGADKLAKEVAQELDIPVDEYKAEWTKYGKAAGPIRNQRMIDEGKPDLVLAFHKDLSKSKGTRDMVNRASKAEIPVKICYQSHPPQSFVG